VALLKAENDRLTLLLEESKNWKHDMESQLKKSKGQVYTLEAELVLAKFAQDDLKEEGVRMSTENERLKQEQVAVEDVMRRAALRRKRALKEAKEQKRLTMRYVLAALNWTKATADPLLLEAACAFWDALGVWTEGGEYCEGHQRVSCLSRKISWKQITLKGWNGDMEK
jgi:hypothetical protein